MRSTPSQTSQSDHQPQSLPGRTFHAAGQRVQNLLLQLRAVRASAVGAVAGEDMQQHVLQVAVFCAVSASALHFLALEDVRRARIALLPAHLRIAIAPAHPRVGQLQVPRFPVHGEVGVDGNGDQRVRVAKPQIAIAAEIEVATLRAVEAIPRDYQRPALRWSPPRGSTSLQ